MGGKRILTLIPTCVLLFGLTACGSPDKVFASTDALSTDVVAYTGDAPQSADGRQRQLTCPSCEPGFVFGGGKTPLVAYLDFSEQRSRDFLLLNSNLFTYRMETGDLNLIVRPVQTGSAFSLYASEALAEASHTAPDRAWPFLIKLLGESRTLEGDETPAEIRDFIVKIAEESGVSYIGDDTLSSGTFAGWSLSFSDDPELTSIPTVFIDGVKVDEQKVNINSQDEVQALLLGD